MCTIAENPGRGLQVPAKDILFVCWYKAASMKQNILFELPDTCTFSGVIGELSVSFRRIANPFTQETGYLITLSSNDSNPSTFSMRKIDTTWQIRDKTALLLFGHLQKQLNSLILLRESA
jgi:hypothetical protein